MKLPAQGEHLQRELQATAKENREGADNRANDIDHKSAVTRCSDSGAASGWCCKLPAI
jgi:hypothetical protein